MAWLFGWLLFGMLAVKAVGGLPVAQDSAITAMVVIVCALVGIGSLSGLVVGASRRGRRGLLTTLMLVCLAGLGIVLWAMRRSGANAGADWIATLMAAEAYFFFSFCVAVAGSFYSWRVRLQRRRQRREQLARADHRERLDRMGMPVNPVFQAMGLRAEDDPWPDSRGADKA